MEEAHKGGFCYKVQCAGKLFRKIFKSHKHVDERTKDFQHAIQTRAWIMHSVYTLQRISELVLSRAPWQSDECINLKEESKACPAYNNELLDPATQYLRVIVVIYIMSCILFDIACYKYRYLSHCLIYTESVVVLILNCIPQPVTLNHSEFDVGWIGAIFFVALYTGQGAQIIANTLSIAISIFIILPVGHYKEVSTLILFGNVISLMVYFLL